MDAIFMNLNLNVNVTFAVWFGLDFVVWIPCERTESNVSALFSFETAKGAEGDDEGNPNQQGRPIGHGRNRRNGPGGPGRRPRVPIFSRVPPSPVPRPEHASRHVYPCPFRGTAETKPNAITAT